VVTFRKQALEVVAQASPGVVYRLHESILSEHIEPSECKVRVKKDHVLVILQKVYEKCFWEKLGVNRKAVGPVRTSPPDFGKPTVVTTGGTAAPYPVPATPDSAPAAAVA